MFTILYSHLLTTPSHPSHPNTLHKPSHPYTLTPSHNHTLTVDEMMVTLLDSDRREIVYCACGVLVNLMADTQHRDSLSHNGGIRK